MSAATVKHALELSLQFGTAEHKPLLTRARVKRWVSAAIEADAVLTLRFVDEEEGRELNHGYRGKGYATNVLTFDYSHNPVEADVVLCCPVVEREAAEQGKELMAHYAHLIVHGVLHAQGYDHLKAKDAKLMEAREVALLAGLGFENPYL
jgi:probable rRNA maturation factor